MIDSTSLSKTDSPFLREARYFNNNFGSLALMNTVYDLSFDINDDSANTYFYPGMLINVIIADFGGEAIDAANYKGTNNDPHKIIPNNPAGTPAHYLGIGGYFIIKSVTYNLGISQKKFGVKVECKFLGTDADSIVKKPKDEIRDIIASDNKDCLDAYNEAVRINQATIKSYNENRTSEEEEKQQQFTEIAPNPSSATTTGGDADAPSEQVDQAPDTIVDIPSAEAWTLVAEQIYVNTTIAEQILDSADKGAKDNNIDNQEVGNLYVNYYQEFIADTSKPNEITRYELLVEYGYNGTDYTAESIFAAPRGIEPRVLAVKQ